MKAEIAPRASVIDALTTGLTLAARRPGLLVIPILIDLSLWLAPRLSVQKLLQQARVVWEALMTAFYSGGDSAALTETMAAMRSAFNDLGQNVDLLTALTTGWLTPPSALVEVQATRMKLISDAILAPVGVGLNLPQVAPSPWQGPAIEVTNVWLAGLIIVVLWVVGQVLTTLYLRAGAAALVAESTVAAAHSAAPRTMGSTAGASVQQDGAPPAAEAPAPNGHDNGAARRLPLSYRAQLVRFAVLSLVLGIAVYLIRMPLALAMALAVFSGSALAAGVFVLSGGLTLWFMLWVLSAVFFASEAILFDGQPLGPALWQALVLVRASGWRTFGLILVINVITLGFHAVWGLMGQTPFGTLFSILGNAYLVTGLLLAIFVYYNGLRRELQMLRAGRRVIK